MQPTARIIDLNRFRQRRQARKNAELMWAMYAAQAGLSHWTTTQAASDRDSHSVRS